jgi:hypothetical protein
MSDQIVLARYMSDINAIVAQDNQMLATLDRPQEMEPWTEEDTIAALFGTALERERKLQTIRDNRASDPPWITQLVRDVLADLRGTGD